MRSYDTFHDAYGDLLDLVFNSAQFVNAPRGFKSREVLNSVFTVRNPRERVSYLRSRRVNIVFCFAEALWYLSGGNTLDHIAYYAPSMRRYSMDGRVLTGTAYGPKIFGFGPAAINQWDRVARLLTDDDPDSKRAFIQIFDANEVLTSDNVDVSCTIGLQMLVRERKLYTTAYMRANDAFRGIVGDVFSFSFMQELLAAQLGLAVGDYCHVVGTSHVYETDDRWASEVVDEARTVRGRPPPHRFPAVPPGDNWRYIREVLRLEAELRTGHRLRPEDLADVALPEYWRQVVVLFEAYREVITSGKVDTETLEMLWPVYRYFVGNRWPVGPAVAQAEYSADRAAVPLAE